MRLMNSGEAGFSNMLTISNDNKSSMMTQNHVMSLESVGSQGSRTRFLRHEERQAATLEARKHERRHVASQLERHQDELCEPEKSDLAQYFQTIFAPVK
jgi:hypothetical protein